MSEQVKKLLTAHRRSYAAWLRRWKREQLAIIRAKGEPK